MTSGPSTYLGSYAIGIAMYTRAVANPWIDDTFLHIFSIHCISSTVNAVGPGGASAPHRGNHWGAELSHESSSCERG